MSDGIAGSGSFTVSTSGSGGNIIARLSQSGLSSTGNIAVPIDTTPSWLRNFVSQLDSSVQNDMGFRGTTPNIRNAIDTGEAAQIQLCAAQDDAGMSIIEMRQRQLDTLADGSIGSGLRQNQNLQGGFNPNLNAAQEQLGKAAWKALDATIDGMKVIARGVMIIGGTAAGTVGGGATGSASGATRGGLIGGPAGAAVGAVAGAIAGAVAGAISGAISGIFSSTVGEAVVGGFTSGAISGVIPGAVQGGRAAVGVAAGAAGAAAEAGAAAATGIGTQAVVSSGLGAGQYPALLINGTVYVARMHNVAWQLAGRTGEVLIYGIVEIDAAGRVVRWLYR